MITSILLGIVSWLVTFVVIKCLLPLGVLFFNTIVDSRFTNFNEITTIISTLFDIDNPDALGNIITGIAITLLMITMIYAIIKSMSATITGKEEENPLNIIGYTIFAAVGVIVYPILMSILTDFLNSFAQGSLIAGKISVDAFDYITSVAAKPMGADVILACIIIVAIVMTSFGAAITFIERYLSLAVYVVLGPICVAFYPNRDTRPVFNEWIKGLMSQCFAIILSMFFINLAGRAITNFGSKEYAGLDGSVLISLVIILVLLNFVKNSEKFAQQMGFRTMPNMDSARSFAGALGTTAALGIAATRFGGKIMQAREKQAIGEINTELRESRDASMLSKEEASDIKIDTINQRSGNREGFRNDLEANVSDRLVASQAKNTPLSKDIVPMSKEDYVSQQVAQTYSGNPNAKSFSIGEYNNFKSNTEKSYDAYKQSVQEKNEARSTVRDAFEEGTISQIDTKTFSEAFGLKEAGLEPQGDIDVFDNPELKESGQIGFEFSAYAENANGEMELGRYAGVAQIADNTQLSSQSNSLAGETTTNSLNNAQPTTNVEGMNNNNYETMIQNSPSSQTNMNTNVSTNINPNTTTYTRITPPKEQLTSYIGENRRIRNVNAGSLSVTKLKEEESAIFDD